MSPEFGSTAVRAIGLGKENAGYRANLYYYNKSAGALEFICADEVSADGTVSLAFTHASDYVIVIDKDGKDGDKKRKRWRRVRTAGNTGREQYCEGCEKPSDRRAAETMVDCCNRHTGDNCER